jgi:hypothetical protein
MNTAFKLLFGCVMLLVGSSCYALNGHYAESFRKNLWLIIDRHPHYSWGGSESEQKGVDCSGYLYLAARRSAIPVKRVTAFQMRAGAGGWSGKDINLKHAGELDIVFWTWKESPNRPHGHAGAFIAGRKSGLLEVTHSSSSKGVIVQELKGQLLRDISAMRYLEIGDKN